MGSQRAVNVRPPRPLPRPVVHLHRRAQEQRHRPRKRIARSRPGEPPSRTFLRFLRSGQRHRSRTVAYPTRPAVSRFSLARRSDGHSGSAAFVRPPRSRRTDLADGSSKVTACPHPDERPSFRFRTACQPFDFPDISAYIRSKRVFRYRSALSERRQATSADCETRPLRGTGPVGVCSRQSLRAVSGTAPPVLPEPGGRRITADDSESVEFATFERAVRKINAQ